MLGLLLLAGCAVHDLDYGPGAPSAVHADGDGLAEVYILRPGIFGLAVPGHLAINGQPLPRLWAHRSIYRRVSPGTVEIVADGEVRCHLRFVAEADHVYYVDTAMVMSWVHPRWQLELAHPDVGAEWASSCAPARERPPGPE